jgi:membrane-bound lytic murein transglycosylase D
MRSFLSIALIVFAVSCASSSPPPTASTVAWDVANLPHERVDYWISRFTSDKRAEFASYLARKSEYESMIRRKLRERGMPEDLIYLAMIESGFNPEAHSAESARGIWQLIPDTARRFGLRVDDTVDERLDPEKSTDAALEYLSRLYQRFDSWYLAAAAYNSGENRVARIMVENTGNDEGVDADYYRIWDHLPAETRDFIPVMIAAARIAKEPARYGFAG